MDTTGRGGHTGQSAKCADAINTAPGAFFHLDDAERFVMLALEDIERRLDRLVANN